MALSSDSQRELKIGQLAQAARVCGLSQRNTVPSEVRRIVARADADKRPMDLEELSIVCKCCSTSEHAVQELIAQSSHLVDEARRRLLNQQPQLVLPGGQLYPEQRAEACWRDINQFLRVITYGVACDCADITDKVGMKYLRDLYELLDVPVPALLFALTQLRDLSTLALEKANHEREMRCLNMAIDDLMTALLP